MTDSVDIQRDESARIKFICDHDRVFQLFGMEIEEAREGYARLTARVGEDFLNAHNVAHGAFIFAVADVAFALAVNSIVDSMGIQWSMNLLRSALPGETIVGECRVIHRGRRTLVVDFVVKGREARLIARGQATALPVDKDRFR